MDIPPSDNSVRPTGEAVAIWGMLLAPVMAHVVGVTAAVWRGVDYWFGSYDLVVYVAILVYLAVAVAATRTRGHAIRLIALVYAVLLPVMAGELVLRWLNPVGGSPQPHLPMHRVEVAADTMPGIDGEIEFSVNSLGLRGPEVDLNQVDVRILCVGGSTTECVYVTDELSWPWRLGDRLSQVTGKSVFVGNAGLSGQILPQHRYLLEKYDAAKRFDWIVILCGINDMGALLRDQYDTITADMTTGTLVTLGRQPSDGEVYYRELLLVEYLTRLVSTMNTNERLDRVAQDAAGVWYRKVRQRRRDALDRHGAKTQLPAKLDEALNRYRSDIEKTIELCRGRGQQVVFLTQPTMYRKDLSDELRSLLWQHSPIGTYAVETLGEIIAAYNKTLMEVCREKGVDCVDLASRIAKDTSTMYDDCHFNTEGSIKVSEVVLEYFVNKLGSKAR